MRSVRYRLSKLMRRTAVATLMLTGCHNGPPTVHYVAEAEHSRYRDHATEIDYPDVDLETPETVGGTEPPRTLLDEDDMPIRDITLMEAVHTGLQNAEIIRSAGSFLVAQNPLYTAGEQSPSSLDPAIQESGVLFGGRGVEAALADFDTRITTDLFWSENRSYSNTPIAAPGSPAFINDIGTGTFSSVMSKRFAQGGALSLTHSVLYNQNNSGQNLFPSSFSGGLTASYRQPLLAGAGAEFTRIAGPLSSTLGGVTGVSQGVVIARINNDITLATFEFNLRNLVKDIEDGYWDLYLAYRNYDVAVSAYSAAAATWRQAEAEFEAGAGTRAAAAQARDQLFLTRAQQDNARSNIYTAETRYRRLIGLPVNDGSVLRPADEPITAQVIPDWNTSLTQALSRRLELRRQKFTVKSLELQLRAARNLTKPQLDLLAQYNLNGFGNQLLGVGNSDPAGTSQGLNNFYNSLLGADTTGYGFGVEMNIPIGFRSALAQVRNYELRLTKAQKLLHAQELEISHELAASFQEVARAYAAAKSNLNRYLAAEENVRFLEPRRRERDLLIDEFLRAQTRRSEAESAYYSSLVDYNKALTALFYREERLLEHDNIRLAEGAWTHEAYDDSARQGWAEANAIENPHIHSEPEPFISPVPVDALELNTPAASGDLSEMKPEREVSPTPASEEPAHVPPEPEAEDATE